MNNLKYFRKKKNISQAEVAKYLGLSQTAYGHYETGRRQIPIDSLTKLADFYGVSVDDLLGRGSLDGVGIHPEEKPELISEDEVMIPLVASLRCGPGRSGEPFTFIKPVPIPSSYERKWGKGLMAIIAVGESMSPTIIPGDMLICRPGEEWIDGNVVSVNVDDMDMIKRIYHTHDGGVDLCSDNPNFDTIHISMKDVTNGRFHVLGRVLLPIGKEL